MYFKEDREKEKIEVMLMDKLLSVKKIIALLLTIVFCVLSITKHISSTEFLSIFTMVTGFYFGQSVAKRGDVK